MTYHDSVTTSGNDGTPPAMAWDDALAGLLQELSRVQDELLDVLTQKQQLMATGDVAGMAALEPREQRLCQDLQHCHERRAELLQSAAQNGLPADTLGSLASVINPEKAGRLQKEVKKTSARMRLLQHQSLANWVLAQKALLHVSRLLEIIATGGRLQPTYGNEESRNSTGGVLVDQHA